MVVVAGSFFILPLRLDAARGALGGFSLISTSDFFDILSYVTGGFAVFTWLYVLWCLFLRRLFSRK